MAENVTPARPLIEWVFGLFSGCAVAVLLGFLGWQALFADTDPARLTVRITDDIMQGDARSFRFEVENQGGRAASGVVVLGHGEQAERSVEFDYVAPHSRRHGTFTFPATAAPPLIEIGGYSQP